MATAESRQSRTSTPGPLAGAVLSGKCRLVQQIAEGSVGVVYAGETLAEGHRVAIKLLRPELSMDEDVAQRFVDEARAAERLVHPNIVHVFGHGVAEDGTPYIVMELLEGVSLSSYTLEGARIPLPQALVIVSGVLSGLAAAHQRGVVHRDLKPGNVFLARDAAGRYGVKLLDFGIAKVMDAAGGMGTTTRTGMLLGTPAYMSPEQIVSARQVDHRTDLWSTAVILYKMLSGAAPFSGATEFERLNAILHQPAAPLREIDPSFAIVDDFLERAMSKDREERFSSAQAMREALTIATRHVLEDTGAPDSLKELPGGARPGNWYIRPSTSPSRAPSAPGETGTSRSAIPLAVGIVLLVAVLVVGVAAGVMAAMWSRA